MIAAAVVAGPAWAGETPLYQPAPAWVTPAQLPAVDKAAADTPALLIYDLQQRIEKDRLWIYSDTATRIASPEALAQLATLTVPWAPDKGDLIIHELKLLRGSETIDLLASGKRFTTLRREEGLERRELTGVLTATITLEGLQIGDIVRMRYSVNSRDDALLGKVQSVVPVIASPVRIGFARLRTSFANDSGATWKFLGSGPAPTPVKDGEFTTLSVSLPLPKQPEMPLDAPLRYQRPPLLEVSTFARWSDVSQVMAPLYRTDGLIAPGSPLAAELDKIRKAGGSKLEQTQRALRLVQDAVRYMMVGMDGGNYRPQSPQQTWTLRYGDCKAKTLLLLALLHGLGIEAEAVAANALSGDFVPERLPSAAAFNHVLVRAVVDGETLWLDGTRSGDRIEDIHDAPSFRSVLPLRSPGAELLEIPARANARPLIELSIDADESASVDLPSVFEASAVLRGPMALVFRLANETLDKKQQDEQAHAFFTQFLGEAQFGAVSISSDPAAAVTTLKASGVTTTAWRMRDRRMERWVTRGQDDFQFAPDRSKAAWASIPVATGGQGTIRYRLRVKLPDGGRNYTIEGEPNTKVAAAGRTLSRSVRIAGGVLEVDERMDATGEEIPVSRIPVERERAALVLAQAPRLIASADATRRWALAGRDPAGATQLKSVEATFAKAIAADPDEATGYISRANMRIGVGDRKGALADLDAAIRLAADAPSHLRRAALRRDLGDAAGALADASKARELDPSLPDAIGMVAMLKAEQGDLTGAIELIDQRIALGGEERDGYRQTKAALIGEFGDPQQAIALYDAMLLDKPGSPQLLNGRCWTKGTRSVALDSALKDCTEAIELSSSTQQALDSRAMVWFRLGKYDAAMRDLDAVLATAPGLPASRYLRGVVLARLDRASEAAAELALARRMAPLIDVKYGRFGIKP